MRGYQALTAASGEQALQQCAKSEVNLVLLDIRMENGMDGVETLVKLRELYPTLNVVMMSGASRISRSLLRRWNSVQSGISPNPSVLIKFCPMSNHFWKYRAYRKKTRF